MENKRRLVVQCSSRSWSGGADLSMNVVNGHPAVYWTVKSIATLGGRGVHIAAPEYDRGGALEAIARSLGDAVARVHYGSDSSPLNRMLDVCRDLSDDDYVLRVDGLHLFVDTQKAAEMLALAEGERLDCVKFPDDFPPQFTSDVYRVGALRKLDALLTRPEDAIYRVHPKYWMAAHPSEFRCRDLPHPPEYDDAELERCRHAAEAIYGTPRLEVSASRIWCGDQLTFHYELALEHLEPAMRTLDIACGNGYGTRLMAKKLREVHGGDLDAETVREAQALSKGLSNCSFSVQDTTRLTFANSSFDAIVSMETLEHVDDEACLAEFRRVLRPGGRLVLSTPQNRLGRIPIVSCHTREYALAQLEALCRRYFRIREVIGLKAGRIVVPNDPIGRNTVVVCERA